MAIKVSQATIDKIKKMGMTAALKSAPKANAEMAEGLRRMYGAKRLEAAMGSNKQPRQGSYSTGKQPRQGTSGVSLTRTPARRGATSGPMSANTPARRNARTSGPMSANTPAKSKVTTSSVKKSAPAKRQSDAEKLVGGIKRVVNSSPGANIRKSLTSSKTTSASAAERRKAAADAKKRAGGRNL